MYPMDLEHGHFCYIGGEKELPQVLEAAKAFSFRKELNGHWDGEGFWGTRQAADLLRAFHDGWIDGWLAACKITLGGRHRR
jgi:hypothetical protein